MLEEQGGGVDTRSLEDRFKDPLCIVAPTPWPTKDLVLTGRRALNPDSVVDNTS